MGIVPTRIVPRISFGRNATLLPLDLYPRIKAATRLSSAPSPTTLTHAEIQVRGQNQFAAGGFSAVYGLTEAEFALRFPEGEKQWKQLAPDSWQFQGGDLVLETTISVFINENYKHFDHRDAIFDLVMAHELEHVEDDIDNIEKHLPALVSADSVVRKLLFDDGTGQPAKVVEREYRHWMFEKRSDLGREWTHLEHRILAMWADKHNALGRSRDSGTRWVEYQDSINFLRNGMPKYVVWPRR